MTEAHGSDPSPIARRGSVVRTLRAVGGAFFGVRKSSDLERDMRELNPLHLVVAGVVAAAAFVGLLVVAVNWIVGSGIAR